MLNMGEQRGIVFNHLTFPLSLFVYLVWKSYFSKKGLKPAAILLQEPLVSLTKTHSGGINFA